MLELYRVILPEKPHNWALRWKIAGDAVKWKGVSKESFKAENDSPIWQVLANDFDDSTGKEKPPFFYNSGMGLKDERGHVIYGTMEDEEDKENSLGLTDEELLALVHEQIFTSCFMHC